MHWMIVEQNQAFAWEDPERGRFKEEYFPAIEIPMVAHVPWVERPFRVPLAIYKEICGMIKKKIDAGVYKLSNSSYHSRWFCMIKKDRKSLHIVHSLEPLNRVTIAHSRLPPATEELAMHFVGRACGGILDLYAGGTFSGPKTKICDDHITIVGFDCLYKGRKPIRDAIEKIMWWGPYEDTTDVRVFLGTVVQCCSHIPNFVTVAAPLYEVVKKDVPFEWGPVQEKAQSGLKMLIKLCFHTRNPKFPSEQLLVLAVDTS